MTETNVRKRRQTQNLVPDLRSVPELRAWLRERIDELAGLDEATKDEVAQIRADAAEQRKKLRIAIRQGSARLAALEVQALQESA